MWYSVPGESTYFRMPLITLKLTTRELELLASLASDQLFRREFIDPKMPGYRVKPEELLCGKKLVERLRLITDRANGAPLPKKNGVKDAL